MKISTLLVQAIAHKASDLHVSAYLPAYVRIDGVLQPLAMPPCSEAEIWQMLSEIMTAEQRHSYETLQTIDFALDIPNMTRCRVHIFQQARGVAAAFRLIQSDIPSLDSLQLPPILKELSLCKQGLILVTGPTGTGKTTTLAAMVDYLNQNSQYHIVTIEDPIEFLHSPKLSLIHQRELQTHTPSFSKALKATLREDPDVILVGELRDLETIRLAITAAETGHLVLATLHTNSATQTIHRLIGAFPALEQPLIRSMLAECLQAVIAQRLYKKIGSGRIAALEIMLCTSAIRHLIREDKPAQMMSVIQTGKSQGMQTLEQHLTELTAANLITPTLS